MFDERAVVNLIRQYRVNPDDQLLNRRLFKAFLPLIEYMVSVPSDHQLYDDLVQEAMIKIHSTIPKFDPDRGKAYSFFSTVIRNKLNTVLSSIDTKQISVDPDDFQNPTSYSEALSIGAYEIPDESEEKLSDLVDNISWRVKDVRYVQACNFFRTYLRYAKHPEYREPAIRSAKMIYNITRADAEFCLHLVIVTLRRNLIHVS